MRTTYGSSLLSGKWVYKTATTGKVIYDQSRIIPTSVRLDDEKASVTSGVFIPGIYRVNPYKVYKESYIRNPDNWVDSAIDAGMYAETATIAGDFGPILASYVRAMLPGITSGIGNHRERVIQKAYGKLCDSSVNLGETLGEFRETLGLLRSPFKDLRNFFCDSNFRRLGLWNTLNHYAKTGTWAERGGRVLNDKVAAKVAANSWLEFRYGLMPLIMTAQDAIKLVNTTYGKLDALRIRTARASLKREIPIGLPSPNFTLQLFHNELYCEAIGVDACKFYACVHYRMKGLPTMADLLQLTPRYWPELAWELTRLSFVVDWFFDVSQWLAALRFTPEVQVLGNTVGVKVDRQVSVKVSSACVSTPGAPRTNRGKLNVYRLLYYARDINQSLPLLPLYKPEFNNWLHTIDSLALILQPVLGRMRKP